MVALIAFFLSVLDFPAGAKVVYALEKGKGRILAVTRIELPTYYLFFILVGIILITWGIMAIFRHQDHDH